MSRRKSLSYSRTSLAGAFGLCLALVPAAAAVDRGLLGYNNLSGLLADGAGVPVAQVEVFNPGTADYGPDTSDLTLYPGKTFTPLSGFTGVSPHANEVANLYYGHTASAAPDATDVKLYSADGFVRDVLRTGRVAKAPRGVGAAVVNNSWIAAYTDDATNVDILRRVDDLINRDDVLMFNAVSNTASDPFPKLLGTSYNGVTVGTRTGSFGPVTFDAAGARIKPDLIVDTGTTSDATALASGAGTLIRSEARARGLPAGELATKAILMASAHRDAAWHRGRLSGRDNTTAPLDFQQGAGQLRVDHAFDVLTAGQQPAGGPIAPAGGWDFARTARATRDATYYLHVDADTGPWAAMLAWNRLIAGPQADGHYDTTPTVANLALSLYLNRRGGRRLVATSDSPADNVESITLTDLSPGDYQLAITGDLRSYYGLAWFADPDPAAVRPALARAAGGASAERGAAFASLAPEPSCMCVLVTVPLLFRRATGRRRRPSGTASPIRPTC